MRKSQTKAINIFLILLILFLYRKIYIFLENIFGNGIYNVTFVLKFFRVAGYSKAVIKHQRPYRYVLVMLTPYFDLKYGVIN